MPGIVPVGLQNILHSRKSSLCKIVSGKRGLCIQPSFHVNDKRPIGPQTIARKDKAQ